MLPYFGGDLFFFCNSFCKTFHSFKWEAFTVWCLVLFYMLYVVEFQYFRLTNKHKAFVYSTCTFGDSLFFLSFEIAIFILFQSNISRPMETYTFRFRGGTSKILTIFSIERTEDTRDRVWLSHNTVNFNGNHWKFTVHSDSSFNHLYHL